MLIKWILKNFVKIRILFLILVFIFTFSCTKNKKNNDNASTDTNPENNFPIKPATDDKTPPVTTVSHSGNQIYYEPINLTLTCDKECKIYYSIDESEPTPSSSIYISPLNFETNTTLKFFSVDKNNNKESVRTIEYKIDIIKSQLLFEVIN
jgi:hypothetical protein